MNKRILQRGLAAVFAGLISVSAIAASSDEPAKSIDELIQLIKNKKLSETKEQAQREAEFKRERANQQRLLDQAKATLKAEEARSDRLEKQFADNERAITNLQDQYEERLGSLKELFGHLSAAAGDVASTIDRSLVSVQYPNRSKQLADLITKTSGSVKELPSVEEIEAMWLLMYEEMAEAAKVVKFTTSFYDEGEKVEREVVRIGTYGIASEGEYLNYDNGTLSTLPRQPQTKYTSSIESLQNSSSGFNATGIDPSGAQGDTLMTALVDLPTIPEKWHEGGIVGYIISGIGVVAILLALWRYMVLSGLSARVNSQLRDTTQANTNNPLGRVLKVAQENPGMDAESLELKLHEAVLKERPAIESGLNLLKIIAMVAPLLGLLGTVTGMIVTFQQITIFGAGDPKNMAGGISQALVTTVLGLCVAIPTVLLHTFVNGRAQRILHVLEEQSAGIVAENAEGR
ncbi:MotA/TolQ/ExbB proton channel family protein [Porticoccaceae bacterium LTM1]|nr:MotA/TolQ/ExbB proton channel family protein [Porticoccaceae bacterium LTM1]